MLHLFNKCYVYPDVLFDATRHFVVVGDGQYYGSEVQTSSYYLHVEDNRCLGRFKTYEEFALSKTFEQVMNTSKDTPVNIYANDEEFINLYAALYRTYFIRLDRRFFLDSAKYFAHKIHTQSKLLELATTTERVQQLAKKFVALTDIPDVKRFPVSKEWIQQNAGFEWLMMKAKHIDSIDDALKLKIKEMVHRFVYSFYKEASHKFLGRCELLGENINNLIMPSNNHWAVNSNYATYDSFMQNVGEHKLGALYQEIRKHTTQFADLQIQEFLNTQNYNAFLTDPKTLLIVGGNSDKGVKINTWLLRQIMKTESSVIKAQGFIL